MYSNIVLFHFRRHQSLYYCRVNVMYKVYRYFYIRIFSSKIPGFLLCSVLWIHRTHFPTCMLKSKHLAAIDMRYNAAMKGTLKIATFYRLLFVNQLTAHRLIQKKTFRHSFFVLDFQVLLPQTLCLWGVSLKGPKKAVWHNLFQQSIYCCFNIY